MSNTRKLWTALAVLLICSFSVLLWAGGEIFRAAPPMPERVVAEDGAVIYSRADIEQGRQVWQSMGGMQLGSIWGHGAYVAPDWSADWLHREATEVLNLWARRDDATATYAQLPVEQQAALQGRLQLMMRRNTYDPATQTITLTRDRAVALSNVAAHYISLFGNDPANAELREAYAMKQDTIGTLEHRRALTAFFWWTAWAATTERAVEAETLAPDQAGVVSKKVLLALSVYLLRYKIALTSDSLFYDDLATDLFAQGGHWRDWKFSAAPGFVFDMLLYFLAYPIFPDAASRMHFVSAVQAGGLALVAWLTARTLVPALRADAGALLVMLAALATLVSAKSGMWLYYHTTNNHFSTLLLALLMMVLLIRFIEQPGRGRAALAVLTGAAASASSGLFALSFTAPALLLAVAAFVLLPRTGLRRRLAATMAILIGAQVLGKLAEMALITHQPVEARAPLTAESIGNSMAMFVRATTSAFAPDNPSTLVFAVGCAGALAFLLYRLVRRLSLDAGYLQLALPNWKPAAAAALLCIAIPVNILGVILSAGIVDLAGYRYLMFPIALALILTVIALNRAKLQAAWLLLAVVVGVTAIQHARKAVKPVDEAALVAQCVSGLELQGHKLGAGVADYWNARAVSTYLPGHNPILVTVNSLQPLFWVSTIGPLKNPQRHYNFVILHNDGQGGQFNYTDATVGALLPPPSSVHACADGKHHVWHYAGDQLDVVVKREIGKFLPHLTLAQ